MDRHIHDTSEHPSESYRGSFAEIEIDGMAIMRYVFFFNLMKVNCNNVKHDVADRVRNHKLNEWVRNTLLCVF